MRIKKPAKEKPKLINMKILEKDLKVLIARAKKYTDGNLSLWLRHAGLHYIPKRKDLA